MGRQNQRGLELSFKPAKGSRGRGRWYKKFGGRAVYFGWGDGVTDRASYQSALSAYRRHLADRTRDEQTARRSAANRKLQHAFFYGDYRPELIRLDEARRLIGELEAADGTPDAWARGADRVERRRIIGEIREKLVRAACPSRFWTVCGSNTRRTARSSTSTSPPPSTAITALARRCRRG